MRTSILAELDLEAAALVAGIDHATAERFVNDAARAGLLPRTDDRAPSRYHPLVRTFLEDRLRREIGDSGVADLHRTVARFGEARDWKLAAQHYAAAGDTDEIHRVLVASIQDIMGGGGFAVAESYVRRHPEFGADPTFGLFLSRRDLYAGDFERARSRASAAVDAFPADSGTHLSHLALANLSSVNFLLHHFEDAVDLAEQLLSLRPEEGLDAIARGMRAVVQSSLDADLDHVASLLDGALAIQTRRGHDHYAGITHLNLAQNAWQRGRAEEALIHCDLAIDLLSASSAGSEIPTVTVNRAWALLHLGRIQAGEQMLAAAMDITGPERNPTLNECAGVLAVYGDPAVARALIAETDDVTDPSAVADERHLVLAELLSRDADRTGAWRELRQVDPLRPHASSAFGGRWHLIAAQIEFRTAGRCGPETRTARAILDSQRAGLWSRTARVLEALGTLDGGALSDVLIRLLLAEPVYATLSADDLASRLGDIDNRVLELVGQEAALRPARWRPVLRRAMGSAVPRTAERAAVVLDAIGDSSDIPRLRAFARNHKTARSATLGRSLARRLAPVASIEDLGHVVIRVGSREIDGSSIRRKVLSLVCFLVSRPGFTATRDQVLEALWPELEPRVAVNSLNQTVYFLRRIFEEGYREDESANYVHHDGEVVRLDPLLVTSMSGYCAALIETCRVGLDAEVVDNLSHTYRGRFAIDFEYEDWSSPFRETLHAAYLDVVEQALAVDAAAGRFDRAATIARRALNVDVEADSVETALMRIYEATGSHSAAAEQQSHYVVRTSDEG